MRFSLKQLQVFLAVAAAENVSRAAEQLHLSQSAASSALQSLENAYGVALFDRHGKRLYLNALGRALREEAQALIDHAAAFEMHLLSGDSQPGSLTVGASMSIGNYLAVERIASFKQQYPQSQLQLLVDNTEHVVEQLCQFRLDFALIEGEVNHSDLRIEPWREDELQVFCAPEHPLAKRKSINDEDLLAAQWILREQGSGTRQQFDLAMHDLLPQLDLSMVLQHTEAIKRAVESGLGLGCLSRLTLEDALARGSLVALKVEGRAFKRQLYWAVHKRKFISPGLQRCIEHFTN